MHSKLYSFILIALITVLFAFPAQADQTFNLIQGFNFVAITSTTTMTATDILNANAFVNQIFVFDSTTQQFKFLLRTGDTLFGEVPAFVAGQGVIINTTATGSLTIPGTYVNTTASAASLVNGFNFVGFSPITQSPLAYGILSTYSPVASIFRWDSGLQGFRFVIRLDATHNFGTDFVLDPNTGYFISCSGPATIDFGTAIVTGDGSEKLTVTFDAPVTASAPSLAVNSAALAVGTNVMLTSADGLTVYYPDSNGATAPNVTLDTLTTPGSYIFTGIPMSVPLKVLAMSTTGNVYRAAFVGTLSSDATRAVNDLTTTLALIYEKDLTTLASVISKTPSELAATETQLSTQLSSVIETVQKTLVAQTDLLKNTSFTTVAALRLEILKRIEVSSAMVQQILTNAQTLQTTQTAQQYYAQALALLASQGSQENVEYLKQALSLLGGITVTAGSTDPATPDIYTSLTADEKENIRVATAAAYNSLGDIAAKTGSLDTASAGAPARSFMAAYRSLAASGIGSTTTEGDAAYYYKKGYDECQQLVKEQPTKKSDPDVMAMQLKAACPLAEVDPNYMEDAKVKADALKAKLDQDSDQKLTIGNGLMTIDPVDVLQYKGDALVKGGNPAGAVEVFNEIGSAVKDSSGQVMKDKATKAKNYGVGKAKINMGAFEDAFDSLKLALTEFADQTEVDDADVAKFGRLNEALLAMSAVIEKLGADNAKVKNDTKFNNAQNVAGKIQKKSEIYVKVVYVIVNQDSSGTAGFGDNLIQDVSSNVAQTKLNEAMASMSDFHFSFNTNDYTTAVTKLTTTRTKLDEVLADATAKTQEDADNPDAKRIRGHSLMQKALTYFFHFRITLLQQAKDDSLRTDALKLFYQVKEKYPFLAKEVSERITELERFGRVVKVISNDTFEVAIGNLGEVESLIQAEDFATADTLLDVVVTNLDDLYAKTDSTEASLKKEALIGWARAKFHRFLAKQGYAAADLADQAKAEAAAALKYLRAQYPDMRDLVLDLQDKLSNADAFGDIAEGDDTGVGPIAENGVDFFPEIHRRAIYLKGKADFLYGVGDATNAGLAFGKAKKLLEYLILENTTVGTDIPTALKDLLTDAKKADIQTAVELVIENKFNASDARLTTSTGKIPFWKILMATAMKDLAMMYAERYWSLGEESDRQRALDMLNRIPQRFSDVPFVSEIRELVAEVKGETQASATEPIIGNLRLTPQSFKQGEFDSVNVKVDVIDPQGVNISTVVVNVMFGGELIGQYPMANIPLVAGAPSPMNYLPGINHAGAEQQSPRWEVDVQVPIGAEPGVYDLVVYAVNANDESNQIQSAFFVKPDTDLSGYLALQELYIDFDRNMLVASVDGTIAGAKLTLNIMQLPPQGVQNPIPIPVYGYTNIPMALVSDGVTAPHIFEIAMDSLFDSNFQFFGGFELLAKLKVGTDLKGAKSVPFFREKKIDVSTDPVAARFKQYLTALNWTAAERTTKLAALKKFVAYGYTAESMPTFVENMFKSIISGVSTSVITLRKRADNSDDLVLEYERPDLVYVRARVNRVMTYGADLTSGVLDPFGFPILPPGKSGFIYAIDEEMEQAFQLVNGQWYAVFEESASVVDAPTGPVPVHVQQAFVNQQNVLLVLLDNKVDLTQYELVVSVLQAPDVAKNITVSRPVDGFRNLATVAKKLLVDGVETSTAREFTIPLGRLIPATFPIYGQLEFRAKLRKLGVTTEEVVSDFFVPFFRPIPVVDTDKTDVFARYNALKTVVEGLAGADATAIDTALQPFSIFNYTKNTVDPAVVSFLADAMTGATSVVITPPTQDGVKVEVLGLDHVVLHFSEKWEIVYSSARTAPLILGDGLTALPSGSTGGIFYFPRNLNMVKKDGAWWWARKDNTDLADIVAITDMFPGASGDIVVRTTMDNTTYEVKLFLLKRRSDGNLARVGGSGAPTMYYDAGQGNTWKLPLNQLISSSVLEYGDMIIEARVYDLNETDLTNHLALQSMPHFRPYSGGTDEPVKSAAKKFVGWLSNKKKQADGSIGTLIDPATYTVDAHLTELKKLWMSGNTVGEWLMEGETTSAVAADLRGLLTHVQGLSVVLDETAFSADFPKPDFAYVHAMMIVSGTHTADTFTGLFGGDGFQWVPPGKAGETFRFTVPFAFAMKQYNNLWYLTPDNPYDQFVDTSSTGEPWIQEAYMNEFNKFVVVTNEPPAGTTKLKLNILQPPAMNATVLQPTPVLGYQGLEILKIGEQADGDRMLRKYEIARDRIFGTAFPVFGELIFELGFYDGTNLVGQPFPMPFYRPYENTFLADPVKTRFKNYLTALETLNLETIKTFWAAQFQPGMLPPQRQHLLTLLKDSVSAFDLILENASVDVEAISPDRVRVHAFVPLTFTYRVGQPMGLVNFETGEMLLPPAAAGVSTDFGLPMDWLLVLLPDANGVRKWYLTMEDDFSNVAGGDSLYFMGAYFDPNGRFVVDLSRPLKDTENFQVRAELFTPPSVTSTDGLSMPVSGNRPDGKSYSGTNAPKMAMDVSRQQFSIPVDVLFPAALPVRGEIIVQAVMSPVDDPNTTTVDERGNVLFVENVPHFRPFDTLGTTDMDDVKGKVQEYLTKMCNVFNTQLADQIDATVLLETDVFTAIDGAGLSAIVFADYQYGRISESEKFGIVQLAKAFRKLQVVPDPSTQAFVDQVLSTAHIEPIGPDRVELHVYLTFQGVYRAATFGQDAIANGVWTPDMMFQIMPPAGRVVPKLEPPQITSLLDVYEIPMEFVRVLVKDPASGNWYLEGAGQMPGMPPMDINVPVVFDSHIEYINGVDYLMVGTSLMDNDKLEDLSPNPVFQANFKLLVDVMKMSATGTSYVVPGYADRALNYRGGGLYRRMLTDILDANFPEFGDLELHVKLVDNATPANVLGLWVMPWYRPYEATGDVDTLRTLLYGKFLESVTAMENTDYAAVELALQPLTDGPVPTFLATRHQRLHDHVTGLAGSLAPEAEAFLEPIGPNEAILRVPYIHWVGSYKIDVPGGFFNTEGEMLIPPGFTGEPFDFMRPGMRYFRKDATGWKIAGYRDEDFSTNPMPGTMEDGQIMDAHFEPHPSIGGREILVVTVANSGAPYTTFPAVKVTSWNDSAQQMDLLLDNVAMVAATDVVAGFQNPTGTQVFMLFRRDAGVLGEPSLFPQDLTGIADRPLDVEVAFDFDNDSNVDTWWMLPYFFGSQAAPLEDAYVERPDPMDLSATPMMVSWGFTFPRRRAFADNGQIVEYLDLGPVDPAGLNHVYMFENPKMPPLFQYVPGETGYSDIAMVHYKDLGAPANPVPVTDLAVAQGLADWTGAPGGYALLAVVPQGTMIEMDMIRMPMQGLHPSTTNPNGERVHFFGFDIDPTDTDPFTLLDPTVSLPVAQNWYGVRNSMGPIPDNAIFQLVPGDPGYTPLANVTKVTVPDTYMFGQARTISELTAVPGATTVAGPARLLPVVHVGAGAEIFNTFIAMLNGIGLPQPPATPAPVSVDVNQYDFHLQGQGFGSSQFNPGMGLFFVDYNVAAPPVLVVNNTHPAWYDMEIYFSGAELAAVNPAAGKNGEFFIASYMPGATGPDNIMPISNPFPVTFTGTSSGPSGMINKLNATSVPLTSGLYNIAPDMQLMVEGSGFGAMRTPAGKALGFKPDPDTMNPNPYPMVLVTNAMPNWTDISIQVTQDVISYIPVDVPGKLAVYPYDAQMWMIPDNAMPLSNEIPVKVPGATVQQAIIELVDGQTVMAATAIDLTMLTTDFAISGQFFGPALLGAAPERDLVFRSLDGSVVVPLMGNNMTGWSDLEIIGIPVPPEAAGHGVLFIRDILNGNPISAPVPVIFPGTGSGASIIIQGIINSFGGDPMPVDPFATMPYDLAPMHPFAVVGGDFGPLSTPADKMLAIIPMPGDMSWQPLVIADNMNSMWSNGTIELSMLDTSTLAGDHNGLLGVFPLNNLNDFGVLSNLVPVIVHGTGQTGPQIIEVEAMTVGTSNSMTMPIDMTADMDPQFIVQAAAALPGPDASGNFGLYWQDDSPMPILLTDNAHLTYWQLDGNGTPNANVCLADRQTGLGQLFFAPMPLPTDGTGHSNHVWVNFGGGSTNLPANIDSSMPMTLIQDSAVTVTGTGFSDLGESPYKPLGLFYIERSTLGVPVRAVLLAERLVDATTLSSSWTQGQISGLLPQLDTGFTGAGELKIWNMANATLPPTDPGFITEMLNVHIPYSNGLPVQVDGLYVPPTPVIDSVNTKSVTTTVNLQGDPGLTLGGSGFGPASGTPTRYVIFRNGSGTDNVLTNNGSGQTANWHDNTIVVPEAQYASFLTGTGSLFISDAGTQGAPPYTPLSSLIPVDFGTGLSQGSTGFAITMLNGAAAPGGDLMTQTAVNLGTSFNLNGGFPATADGYGLFFFDHANPGAMPILIPAGQWSAISIVVTSLPGGVAGEGHLQIGPNPYNAMATPDQLSNPVKVLFPGGTTGDPTYNMSSVGVEGQQVIIPEVTDNFNIKYILSSTSGLVINGSGFTARETSPAQPMTLIFNKWMGDGVNPEPIVLTSNASSSTIGTWSNNQITLSSTELETLLAPMMDGYIFIQGATGNGFGLDLYGGAIASTMPATLTLNSTLSVFGNGFGVQETSGTPTLALYYVEFLPSPTGENDQPTVIAPLIANTDTNWQNGMINTAMPATLIPIDVANPVTGNGFLVILSLADLNNATPAVAWNDVTAFLDLLNVNPNAAETWAPDFPAHVDGYTFPGGFNMQIQQINWNPAVAPDSGNMPTRINLSEGQPGLAADGLGFGDAVTTATLGLVYNPVNVATQTPNTNPANMILLAENVGTDWMSTQAFCPDLTAFTSLTSISPVGVVYIADVTNLAVPLSNSALVEFFYGPDITQINQSSNTNSPLMTGGSNLLVTDVFGVQGNYFGMLSQSAATRALIATWWPDGASEPTVKVLVNNALATGSNWTAGYINVTDTNWAADLPVDDTAKAVELGIGEWDGSKWVFMSGSQFSVYLTTTP